METFWTASHQSGIIDRVGRDILLCKALQGQAAVLAEVIRLRILIPFEILALLYQLPRALMPFTDHLFQALFKIFGEILELFILHQSCLVHLIMNECHHLFKDVCCFGLELIVAFGV